PSSAISSSRSPTACPEHLPNGEITQTAIALMSLPLWRSHECLPAVHPPATSPRRLAISGFLTEQDHKIAERMGGREIKLNAREGPYNSMPPAELGRSEPIRDGRRRLSAECRLQPDWDGCRP